MPHLLLIDATLGAVAIMVAVWIVLRSGRRTGPSSRHGEVAGLASEGTALGEMTVVPGLNEGAMDPDPGAREPDPGAPGPDPGAPGPDPGAPEPDADMDAPDPAVREPAGPEQAPPQVSEVADADPGPPEPPRPQQAPSQANGAAGTGSAARAPAAEPGGPPGSDGTATRAGRVSSYYEGADQPMADYLAELGWSEESGARDPGW